MRLTAVGQVGDVVQGGGGKLSPLTHDTGDSRKLAGREVLHASAVITARGVVAFCAVSTTGKSTIAYQFSRRGYGIWADDALAFDGADRGVTALWLPFQD